MVQHQESRQEERVGGYPPSADGAQRVNYVASGQAVKDVKKAVSTVKKAVNKVKSKAKKAAAVVKNTTVRWVKKKVNTVKDAYQSAKSCLKGGVNKCVKETAKKTVKKAVNSVKYTVEAIKQDPWKFIATAAVSVAAAAAVGALCATGVGCLIVAGAVAGAMSAGAGYMVDVAQGEEELSWSGLAGTMIEGGLDGGLTAGISKMTGGLTKLGGKAAGGRLSGKAPALRESGAGKAGRGAGTGHPTEGGRPATREGNGRSPVTKCETHSFDPATRVLMADGNSKPIEDIKPGDEVLATDPETGKTRAQQVDLLHIN